LLDVQKRNIFQFFLLFAIEMAVFSVFWVEKGLGPIGVKMSSTNYLLDKYI